MNPSIKWQRGQFCKFYAKMKIRVGGTTNDLAIQGGDEFEFDGTILKYAGFEVSAVGIRTAIDKGWAATTADSTGPVNTSRPVRNVAKSQSKTLDLSRVQRGGVDQALVTDEFDEETVLAVSDRRADTVSNPRAVPKVITQNDNRRMAINMDIAEEQEGVQIGRVRSPASATFDATGSDAGRIASTIENRVLGRPEFYEKEGVRVAMNVGAMDKQVYSPDDEEGTVVGKVSHTNMKTNRRETQPERTSVRAAAVDPNEQVSPKIRLARRIYSSFPSTWVFSGKLADRLVSVKSHIKTIDDKASFLEALYAVENDPMKKLLEKTYPKVLGLTSKRGAQILIQGLGIIRIWRQDFDGRFWCVI